MGSVAKFTCNEGFILVGNSKRLCLQNGHWSGYKPGCKRMKYNYVVVFFVLFLFVYLVALFCFFLFVCLFVFNGTTAH